MRYPYFWSWLCLITVLNVPAVLADQRARVLLGKVESNLARVNSMQADLISPNQPQDGVTTLRVLRPRYFAMIGSGQKGSRNVFISDVKQILNYDEKTRTGNSMGTEILYEMGNVVPSLFFVASFLEPGLLLQLEQPIYSGEEKHSGKTYRVIKCPATEERGAWKLYIGPKDMLEGIESEALHSKTTVVGADRAWLRNIQLNAPLTPVQFAYAVPKDAKVVPSDDPTNQLPPLNSIAPSFTMPGVNGETLTLGSLMKGKKAVLLNIMFRECGACVQEIPALKRLYADLKDKGLALLAVNILDNRETAQNFIKKYDIPYPMGLDDKAGGGQDNVGDRYHADNGGTNILIGANGRILWYQSGLNEKRLRCVLAGAGIQ